MRTFFGFGSVLNTYITHIHRTANFVWIILFFFSLSAVAVFNLFRSFIQLLLLLRSHSHSLCTSCLTLWVSFIYLWLWLTYTHACCSTFTMMETQLVGADELWINDYNWPLKVPDIFSAKFIWHVKMGIYYDLTINRYVSTIAAAFSYPFELNWLLLSLSSFPHFLLSFINC